MFNWLGNIFPYSDLHSLNLDWILSKMKETAAQAAKAVSDAANALAQVAEAKAAALTAQTAAQDAQTAANKAAGNAASAAANAVQALNAAQTAQETATAANNKAQTAQTAAETAQTAAETAQNTANTAQSAAQTAQTAAETAQNTANTAQSAAQTAQSAAENAQSSVQTANNEINTLKGRFPIKEADIAKSAVTSTKIATSAVTLAALSVKTAYLYRNTIVANSSQFPRTGSATIDQITSGIEDTYVNRLSDLKTDYLQIGMDITESDAQIPNTVFRCISPIVRCINKESAGLAAIAPIIVIKNDTNDVYNGFIKLSQEQRDSQNLVMKCEVIFNPDPPFNNNTKFVITANPVSAQLFQHA